MLDSKNNVNTGCSVGDVEETRLQVGEKSEIVVLLRKGKIKTGPGNCLGEGVKEKRRGV